MNMIKVMSLTKCTAISLKADQVNTNCV